MVQQIIDSNFNKHGLPNTGTGLPNHDKQVPLVVTSKKIVLRDVQNESRMTVPKSVGSSLFSDENGPQVDVLKLSGTKRPTPEYLGSPPHHHSPTSNAANGNLVYVRRRPELELAKSGIFNNTSNDACYPQARGSQDKNTEQRSQVNKPNIFITGVAHTPRDFLASFSSGKPSIPSSIGNCSDMFQSSDSDNHPVFSAISPLGYPNKMNRKHWEERYSQLQDLLKLLDQSNQEDYVQVLHSLPSLELSRHAVELEKRSIQLSLEEAKEMQQVQLLDVLGKYSKNSRMPSAQQGQPEK
ncbi:hypothetical protein Vadar_000140 [Vaccinium darrowii]|uniref:Uncharacterized protein n=1 Tax=Vaccinium darrowii TaxID=229202 RepID=A0ACB7WVX0_9ERIC|nr:hypothetical protein Vadar_000140 [Vaccinium darrowii]